MSFQINFALAVFVVAGFGALVNYLGLISRIHSVKKRSKETVRILRDSSLSDQQKQEELQHQSRKLFKLLGIFVGGNLLALLSPLAVVWILAELGVGSFLKTLAILSRADFLLGVTILGALIYLIMWQFNNT